MGKDTGSISDGYHTFDELYEHRNILFLALCKGLRNDYPIWKSKLHSDGTSFPDMFVIGIEEEAGYQITYHLPMKFYDSAYYAKELERAPEWDGHTPADVLKRLADL